MLVLAGVTLLPLYCHGQFLMTFPILLKGTVGMSSSAVGVMYSVYALSNVLVQYPMGRRLRHADRMKVLAAASTFMGVGLFGAAFAPRGVATAAFVVVVSFGTALLMPFSVTAISHLAPLRLRGRYMGAWTLVWTSGVALGPIFGGVAMDRARRPRRLRARAARRAHRRGAVPGALAARDDGAGRRDRRRGLRRSAGRGAG